MADQQPQAPQIDYDALAADVQGLSVSHEPEKAPAEHPHARTWRLVRENLPAIGATGAVALTGGTALLPAVAAAALGGAGGSGLQQIDRAATGSGPVRDSAGGVLMEMAGEGAKQGAYELGGGAVLKGGRLIGRGLMKGTVPKNIAKDFDNVDIASEMLDRGVVPGSARSAKRVTELSKAATVERDAAAAVVPNMPRRKVIEGLRPLHAKATLGKKPEMASDVLEHMRTSAREIGPTGLSGPEALARKDIEQSLGKAATTSANPRQAAFGPQMHDAERGAIVSHLRETPRMATALDESQTLMAIDQVMKDASHSNPITRGRIGGLTAASMSPIGLGATAHAVNQGAKVADPRILRLLDMIMGQQQ